VGLRTIADVEPTFDQYAERYEQELERGKFLTGETREFYSRERLNWVRRLLDRSNLAARRVLDFGCGLGLATPELFDSLGASEVVGVDVSEQSLALAQSQFGSDRARFLAPARAIEAGPFDVAYTNGVFHHIPPAERDGAVRIVYEALRPGGAFAFWENNPWNPAMRFSMSRVSFDKEAITITAPEARTLLGAGGFEVVETSFRFIFPRLLAPLRALEPSLSALPLGAQYLVWCRKPSGAPTAESVSKSSPAPSGDRASRA
jgi:SAM-dependent methyltransferase